MGNRQERKARKERQRAGEDVFVHVKPNERRLAPIPIVRDESGKLHASKRAIKNRTRLYAAAEAAKAKKEIDDARN